MGTENPNRPNYPLRPATTPFSAPQSTSPFSSSGPVIGSEASAFRPAPPASSQLPAPPFSSGPLVGSEVPGFRPPSVMSNELVRPPPSTQSSYGPSTAGFQRFPTPPMPSTDHMQHPRASLSGFPVAPPPSRPQTGSVSSQASFFSQPQPTPVSMGSPPQNIKTGQFNSNIPPSTDQPFSPSRPNVQPTSTPMGPSYATARGTFQPAFPGYASAQPYSSAHVPPVQPAPFPSQPGGYAPPPPPAPFLAQPRGYMPGPAVTTSSVPYSRDQVQLQGMAPPIASQGLVEDFSSLSLGSVPGSFGAELDVKALPRPLDGDVAPNSLTEMYPMNCNSRVLRLTTGGIPNSQSLASRWHLQLGAVVCPLAESPLGDEVPIVNFGTTGIIRCRRCRTYVNPYVTFTDHGRKWRCNICSLLNDVPGEYFAHVDANGRRVDLDQRPELTKGSVEFIAPAEYMVRLPMPPLYFFLIDVSISAVQSGMLEVVSQQ